MSEFGREKMAVTKYPEYRTTYQQSHSWVAPAGQNFGIHVHVKMKEKQHKQPLAKEITQLDAEHFKTNYIQAFPARACSTNPYQMTKPPICDTVSYVTSFQQKLFRDPPRPIVPFKSEMKDAYIPKALPLDERITFPPNPYSICAMKALGRDEQPALVPEQPGTMKLQDIYLTTARADYIPYDVIQQRGIACKDIITYYDSQGVPRGGKGYGPRKDTKIEPFVKTKKPVYDKKWKKVQNPMQTIPHRGFMPEYKELYRPHTISAMEPYGDLSPVATFPSKTYLSPWQNLSPPGMYCTESCHIGSGHPINAIIETTPPKRTYKHNFTCRT